MSRTCGTGRTDFRNGDPVKSYDSHDYKGETSSTIGEEKRHNPRIAGKSCAEYVAIMAALSLPPPMMIDVAVLANLRCGRSLS